MRRVEHRPPTDQTQDPLLPYLRDAGPSLGDVAPSAAALAHPVMIMRGLRRAGSGYLNTSARRALTNGDPAHLETKPGCYLALDALPDVAGNS
jgi:hypothetical protein